MHQIRQILDFKLRGYPIKKIARHSDIARNTVRDYLRKAAATGIALSDLIAPLSQNVQQPQTCARERL